MTKEITLETLARNLNAKPWIEQLERLSKLLCEGDPQIAYDTYFSMLVDLRDATVAKDAKTTFILKLAIQKYCEIYVKHHADPVLTRN